MGITITRQQFFDFIRKKSDTDEELSPETRHYLKYFDAYQETQQKKGLNWAATLFQEVWLFHRRMYQYAFQLFVFFVVLNSLLIPLISSRALLLGICFFLSVVRWILFLRYSDYLYLLHANKQITKTTQYKGTHRLIVTIAVWGCLNYIDNLEKYYLVGQSKIEELLERITLKSTKDIEEATKRISEAKKRISKEGMEKPK